MQSDIGLVGLAVMGQNLVLNMLDHSFHVSVYNRTYLKTQDFLNRHCNIQGLHAFDSLKGFVESLKRPRKIMLMVQAGGPVDGLIGDLLFLLEKGDIIIDGGNSDFHDTERRYAQLSGQDIYFVGCGVSGGEEGARRGPSLMPGGDERAWPFIKPIFEAICAKTSEGEKCCRWMGKGGSGHYVKMVHNGIEYGDMQLISEIYYILREGLSFSNEEMAQIFRKWNATELDSYLIDITAKILTHKEGEQYLLDLILDKAAQKGTGRWTIEAALQGSIPLTLITESVFARFLSNLKTQRLKASKLFHGLQEPLLGNREEWVEKLRKALLASKVISYAQGFMMLQQASQHYDWGLDFGDIALTWRAGCIIRSVFLQAIKKAFDNNLTLENLILDEYFANILKDCLKDWREAVAACVCAGVSAPCLASGLSFFEAYRTASLPANLIQAQRDYFGAHTYQRLDQAEHLSFHTLWDK